MGIALVLGLLSAIGPFAIDMYLPALPLIGQELQADIQTVQGSLTAFFIAMGLGQLAYGPLSDMFGRKPALYFGLGLFAVASVGCALAGDIRLLIALRFLQGLGAAAGMAVPRAVVRDLHTGVDAARLMSLLMLVFSVSPILAPLAGSAVIAALGWRAVFWAVALAALAGIGLMVFALQETRTPAQRVQSSLGSAWRAYGQLLRDRHFLGLVAIGGFGMAGFFTYLANSSFVLIGHYGLTPTQYSLAFALNAAAFIGAAQFNGLLGRRFGLEALVRFSAMASVAVLLALLIYLASGADALAVLIGLLFASNCCMGFIVPNTAVLALEAHGAIAGTASALMGTLQMVGGALAMSLVGLVASSHPLPMALGMVVCSTLSLLSCWATLGLRRRPRVQALAD